jgi:hypothetical protein
MLEYGYTIKNRVARLGMGRYRDQKRWKRRDQLSGNSSAESESLFLVEAGVWTLFDLHEYGVFENPKSMATVDQ